MSTQGREADKRTAHEIAREYIDTQLRNMQEHGLKTESLSHDEYQALVDDAAENVRA